jgi:hypothetical protein
MLKSAEMKLEGRHRNETWIIFSESGVVTGLCWCIFEKHLDLYVNPFNAISCLLKVLQNCITVISEVEGLDAPSQRRH